MRRPDRRSERGTALVELVWLGVLLLIPMVWILLSVFDVQRGAFGVSSAARAAGRATAALAVVARAVALATPPRAVPTAGAAVAVAAATTAPA